MCWKNSEMYSPGLRSISWVRGVHSPVRRQCGTGDAGILVCGVEE